MSPAAIFVWRFKGKVLYTDKAPILKDSMIVDPSILECSLVGPLLSTCKYRGITCYQFTDESDMLAFLSCLDQPGKMNTQTESSTT